MTQARPSVPQRLKRKLFEEAGYRCAVPTCRATSGLQMEHIDSWAKVQSHEFENMIILCANCHARVTNKEISKEAIKAYKRNLAVINGRYSLYEIRLLELAHQNGGETNPEWRHAIQKIDLLHIKGLVDDGLIVLNTPPGSVEMFGINVTPISLSLTDEGRTFIGKYFSGESIT